MADNVQPDAGEQREESTSGLLLSVDPLQGGTRHKLSGDDSDSDKGGLLGDDSSDSDGGDALGSDSDGTATGGDSLIGGESEESDADASDAGGFGADSDEADAQMNPLGIGDTNVDGGSDADSSDAGGSIRPSDAKDMRD
jgi:hypothetical protein